MNNKTLRDKMRWDITTLLQISSEYGWSVLKKDSIHRILYLSGVLYHFVNGYDKNPFSFYNFSRKGAGPYDSQIEKSLDFLEKDEFIITEDSNEFKSTGKATIKESNRFKEPDERNEWLDLIIQILAIYGEDKIYEFIFRDKEFKLLIATNAEKKLNLGKDNATILYLEHFRKDFEQQMNLKFNDLEPKTYLKIYFDYVFKKILERND